MPTQSRLEHGHTPAEIAQRLAGGPKVSYLRDWVYGGIDGAVTTFALAIRRQPDGEREEIRQLFAAKGFRGSDLERAVGVITASRARWVDTMLAEEHGVPLVSRSPLAAGASTFAAFLICGLVPLLPFAGGIPADVAWSVVLTALVFFAIGSLKSRWSTVGWWRSGAETMAIGLSAAAVAYLVGHLLRTMV